jgi:hypothetical protein
LSSTRTDGPKTLEKPKHCFGAGIEHHMLSIKVNKTAIKRINKEEERKKRQMALE